MSAINLIQKLSQKQDLDSKDCHELVDILLSPESEPLQISALLVLLHAKGESATELHSIIKAVRRYSNVASKPQSLKILDIVGSGGDGANTINISTGSAILAASCGIKIAKHSNRAASSLCGSADILESLGINIHQSHEKIAGSIDTIGIGFYFAPDFYPSMLTLKSIRKKLNVPTTFNILGTLLNPADPPYLIVGAKNKKIQKAIANVLGLKESTCEHALIVHSQGLDEITSVGITEVIEVKNKSLREFNIDPKDYGFSYCNVDELKGGDASINAKLLIDALSQGKGPIIDTLILNCATALWLVGNTKNIHEGVEIAKEAINSGKALNLLNQWRNYA